MLQRSLGKLKAAGIRAGLSQVSVKTRKNLLPPKNWKILDCHAASLDALQAVTTSYSSKESNEGARMKASPVYSLSMLSLWCFSLLYTEPSKRSGSIQELLPKLEISLAGLATDLLAAEGDPRGQSS